MIRFNVLVGIMALITTSAAITVFAQVSGSDDLSWHVIGAGGGKRTSASLKVQDTAGQAVVGLAQSIGFGLGAGFWVGAGAPTVTLTVRAVAEGLAPGPLLISGVPITVTRSDRPDTQTLQTTFELSVTRGSTVTLEAPREYQVPGREVGGSNNIVFVEWKRDDGALSEQRFLSLTADRDMTVTAWYKRGDLYLVRVVYFVPSDREPRPDFRDKMDTALKLVQEYYSNQMKPPMNPFEGKTFDLDLDGDGKIAFTLVRGSQPASYYRGDGERNNCEPADGFIYSRLVAQELFQPGSPFSDLEKNSVLVFVLDIYRYVADPKNPGFQCVDGGIGGGMSTGDLGPSAWGGRVFIAPLFEFMETDRSSALALFCSAEPSGMPWEDSRTKGRLASLEIGRLAHELGHAFDLPHDNRAGGDIDLMWRGFVNIARAFPLPSPCLGGPIGAAPTISECNAAVLNVSRYFNSGSIFPDTDTPIATITSPANMTVFPPGTTEILINGELSDGGGSGLATVSFLYDGNVKGCLPLSGNSAEAQFIYTLEPNERSLGAHGLTTLAYDYHGNRGTSGVGHVTIKIGHAVYLPLVMRDH